jgi:hypothetical protein
MARTSNREKAVTRRLTARFLLWALLVCFALAAILWSTERFEKFLAGDSRFVLPPPVDYGQESPNLVVEGVTFANRAQVLRVFAEDLGRSVFLLPLAERRRALLRVNWIKDASVVRLWPNRVVVHITERRPAAFMGIESECITRWMLIDADGMILDQPQRPHQFGVPLIRGIRIDEKPAMRGMRVRRVQSFLQELGPLADMISEIDAADLDDLKVIGNMQGHAIKLRLGDHNFRDRLQNFLDHYSDIRKRMPDARVLDLRLDDRITVLQEAAGVC